MLASTGLKTHGSVKEVFLGSYSTGSNEQVLNYFPRGLHMKPFTAVVSWLLKATSIIRPEDCTLEVMTKVT